MWGWSFNGDNYFYMENVGGWSDSKIQMVIGKGTSSGYTSCYNDPTKITNTLLIYKKVTVNGWSDATFMGFMGNGSNWGGGDWGRNNITNNATHYALYTSGVDASNGQRYMLTPSTSSNTTTVTLTYLGNTGYSDLNKTVTIRAKVSTNGGSTYSDANTPGALSANSYKFSADATCGTSTSASLSAGGSTKTLTTGYTANTSVSAAAVTGYDFVGWYEGSTKILSTRTGTMNPHGTVTLYAYYKVSQYTVSYGVNSSTRYGSITLNSGSAVTTTSSSTLNHGTAISFTASPNSGYQVEGWYSDASCTVGNRLQSGGNSYDAGTLTAAETVYVKFEAKTGGILTLNAGTGGQVSTDNSTWGSTKYITDITNTTARNIYAQANTGYTFSSWSKTSGSGTITSTSSASTTFTPVAYEDATVAASFSEIIRTINIVGGTAASTTAGIVTTGSATAAAPAAGKKFTGWTLGDGVTLSGGSLTNRTISFTATKDATITANYADRAQVKMYFAKPTSLDWGTLYAYAWKSSDASVKNAEYPGVTLSTTEVINCVTYYVYQYYTEADGIGGAATGNSAWNKIIFGCNNDAKKTGDLNIADGHYYYRATEANTSGKSSAITSAWYIKGTMNDWGETHPITHDCANNKGTVNINLTSGTTYEFKVYNEVNNQMWSNSTALGQGSGITATMASAETLYDDANVMKITGNVTGNYTFEVSSTNATNPKVKVTFPTTYTMTYSIGSVAGTEGSISTSPTTASGSKVESGSIITLTAPDARSGYEWVGWYSNEAGTGIQLCDTKAYAVTVNSDKTVYACYKKIGVTLVCSPTIVAQSGTVTAIPSIYPTPVDPYVICWKLLHSNGNLVESQPTFTPTGVGDAVSFTAPSTSGMYLIAAIQHSGSNCNAGEVLDSVTTSLQVAGNHTVTVQYKCGSETIKESTTVTGRPLTWSGDITAPDIFGYTFSRWVALDGVDIKDHANDTSTTATIQIKAIYDGKLKAEYTQNQYIYFKNTLGWSNVYVNFYTGSYWNNPKGSGNKGVTNKNLAMTRIGETDIWYYDYGAESISPSLYVSFTSKSQNGSENFWGKNPDVNVVYPANYPDAIHTNKSAENGFKAATPMFVPLASQAAVPLNSSDGGKANYYNAGYWTKYTPGTGYTLEIYYDDDESPTIKSIEFTSDDELMPMKAIASLEANTTYRYQLRRGGTGDDGIYYGNTGTMTYSNHEAWDMNNSMYPFQKAKITTNAAGDYTFNLNYAGHKDATTSYRLRMSVDYPIATGDYRLIYKDNAQTNWKASGIVTNVANGKDTVSFFVRKAQTPKLRIQKATVNPSTGAITWAEYPTPGTQTNQITGTISTAITKDSVWNFCLVMDGSGNLSVAKAEAYTGNYYIRTDPANSKWDNYRSDPDHLMTYSEYSITHGGYSHYFCHWVQTDDRKNIKFCIANDYSPSISDTLIREAASGTWEHIADFIDADGNILRNANVRFMWDQHTNTISRAYIDGAYISGGDDFLVLVSGDSKILNPSTSAVQATTTFYDNQNWIYEANVKAIPNAQIKLRSIWGKDGETTHKITQYFKGGTSSTETLITGSGSDPYDIRLLYDFKTNRLVAAMLPSGNYDDPEAIHADVMFIRDHQGDVSQLTFTDDGKITDINTAYAVIQLNKWTLNNKERTGSHAPLGAPASIYERSMYFISFPFQVNLSEVFGFGTYGEHWAIEYYDGEERAAKGYWMGDPGFWKFYWDRRNVVLEPNKGYILAIDLDLLGEESDVWANGNERAELFFPSAGSLGSITNSTVTKSLHEHACTINRAATEGLPDTPDNPHTSYNRTIFDSHWNVMGVPTYVNTAAQSWENTSWITATVDHKTQGPNFLYTWNMDDNTLTPTSGASFKYHAMHSYMVQYYGNVIWKTAQGPAAIVARRAYAAAPKNVEFCIEISDSEKMLDRTFLRLSEEEEVSANFAFNEDMTKDMNGRKANIYTLTADNVAAAGNTMPLNDQTLIVPLNVVTWTADNFTISIPEGTSGIGVTLVDEETGERTNLALGDYSRYLEKGTYSNRFHLEIAPIKQVPTGLEPTSDSSLKGRAQKRLIDGKLYILRDGKVYDARGNKVE